MAHDLLHLLEHYIIHSYPLRIIACEIGSISTNIVMRFAENPVIYSELDVNHLTSYTRRKSPSWWGFLGSFLRFYVHLPVAYFLLNI